MNCRCYSCSVTKSCQILCDPTDYSTPGFPILHYLPAFAQTHIHYVSDAIQPSHPLSSTSPPALNFPSIKVFSCDLPLCIRWSKYWCFSFSISPSNEYSELISFRIVLQSKGLSKVFSSTTIWKHQFFQSSAFFMVQLSHPYMPTGKTIALTIQAKWCPCFWKCCLGSSQFSFQGASIFYFHVCSHHLQWFWIPPKIKSVTASTFSPSICHEAMGRHDLSFLNVEF